MAPHKQGTTTATPAKKTRKPKKPVELTEGSRFYPVIKDGKVLGTAVSVTTVLSNTEGEKAKERLVNWGKAQVLKTKEPGYIDPAKRGNDFDDVISSYCSLPPELRKTPSTLGLHGEVAAMIENFTRPTYSAQTKKPGPSFLDLFGRSMWVQKVVSSDYTDGLEAYKHTDRRGGERQYVASLQHGFAGTPDIIGEFNGDLSLISLKTSNCDYRKSHPGYEALNGREKGAPPPEDWRLAYSGFMKFQKAAMQECAYRLACIETLGISLDTIVILVSTPLRAQAFTLTPYEIKLYTDLFLKRCVTFYKTYGHLVPKEIKEIV